MVKPAAEDGVVWLESCGSTNDEAVAWRGRARAVAAHTQTAGRGRRGRTWVSPPGCGLYLSWIVTPAVPPDQGMALPLLAGVATLELCDALGVRPRLKWPNDVLLGDRKLAGVLCEAQVQGDRWDAIVGIGLNVRTPAEGYPEDVPAVALDTRYTPQDLAPRLLSHLERWHRTLAAQGLPPLIKAWTARGHQIGERLRQADVTGTYLGLSPTGALRLDVGGEVREIVGGEVEAVT